MTDAEARKKEFNEAARRMLRRLEADAMRVPAPKAAPPPRRNGGWTG